MTTVPAKLRSMAVAVSSETFGVKQGKLALGVILVMLRVTAVGHGQENGKVPVQAWSVESIDSIVARNKKSTLWPELNPLRIFGTSIAFLPDMNDDGRDELLVGAPAHKGMAGAVAIIVFGEGLSIDGYSLVNAQSHAALNDGIRRLDAFGASVAYLESLPLGGRRIAVGAPRYDSRHGFSMSEYGGVWILDINRAFQVTEAQVISIDSAQIDSGIKEGAGFGSSLCSIGDLDGNGVVDVAVGSRSSMSKLGVTPAEDRGAVRILYLNRDGSLLRSVKVEIPESLQIDHYSQFGASVACLGDSDANGLPGLLIGAPLHSGPEASTWHGVTCVLSLRPDGSVAGTKVMGAPPGIRRADLIEESIGHWRHTETGQRIGAQFGMRVSTLASCSEEMGGVRGIVLAIAESNGMQSPAGALYVVDYRGVGGGEREAAATVLLRTGASELGLERGGDTDWSLGGGFGGGVAGDGDINGDGVPDVVICVARPVVIGSSVGIPRLSSDLIVLSGSCDSDL